MQKKGEIKVNCSSSPVLRARKISDACVFVGTLAKYAFLCHPYISPLSLKTMQKFSMKLISNKPRGPNQVLNDPQMRGPLNQWNHRRVPPPFPRLPFLALSLHQVPFVLEVCFVSQRFKLDSLQTEDYRDQLTTLPSSSPV